MPEIVVHYSRHLCQTSVCGAWTAQDVLNVLIVVHLLILTAHFTPACFGLRLAYQMLVLVNSTYGFPAVPGQCGIYIVPTTVGTMTNNIFQTVFPKKPMVANLP